MENKKLFKKYQSRMTVEGVIKAVNCGLIVGFSTITLIALITWLVGYASGLWIALGVGLGLGVISAVLFYFLKFRPTEEEIARRVDSLGFEERMITMLELSDDDSYIACRQREDAKLHLDGASAKLLKLKVSTVLVAAASVTVAAGIAMSTVSGLAIGGVIPDGGSLLNPEETPFIEVSYVVEEGGIIDGLDMQVIEYGEDPEPVTAIADDGWVFVGWDDGWDDPYRFDVGIQESYTFIAKFERLSTNGGDDMDPGSGEMGGDSGDEATDKPSESGANGSGGDADGEGDGGDEGGNGNGGQEGSNKPSEGGQGGGAGGRTEQSNQIIDGNTYYGSILDSVLPEILEMLASDTELTPEEKAFLEKYFASL